MKIGVIGLGKMGAAIAFRLCRAGFEVLGFDMNAAAQQEAREFGVHLMDTVEDLAQKVDVVWLMVPAGNVVDHVIAQIRPELKKGALVVDGGNSHFTDSVRRHQELAHDGIEYLDVGTSGGVHGREEGFSLMIGGSRAAYEQLKPVFDALAMPHGYGYMGPSGAGHYVKMVHNGIEYALMQAYAEGLDLIKNGHYKDIDLETVTRVWSHGSVIRSWLLDLLHNILKKDQQLTSISGKVGGGDTGRWTVQEAHEQHIPVTLIEDALKIREASQKTGGNYATKLVALLRNQFGGHSYETK